MEDRGRAQTIKAMVPLARCSATPPPALATQGRATYRWSSPYEPVPAASPNEVMEKLGSTFRFQ
jgi:hypothetical protein